MNPIEKLIHHKITNILEKAGWEWDFITVFIDDERIKNEWNWLFNRKTPSEVSVEVINHTGMASLQWLNELNPGKSVKHFKSLSENDVFVVQYNNKEHKASTLAEAAINALIYEFENNYASNA